MPEPGYGIIEEGVENSLGEEDRREATLYDGGGASNCVNSGLIIVVLEVMRRRWSIWSFKKLLKIFSRSVGWNILAMGGRGEDFRETVGVRK